MLVAARPRFLKCYDEMKNVNIARSVAARPRFLKCYDHKVTVVLTDTVAARPRFLKCYDSFNVFGNAEQLQLDRDF